MINVGVSCGLPKENRYNLNVIPKNIQLAMFKYDQFESNYEEIFFQVDTSKTNVLVTHLPLDTMKIDFNLVMATMGEIARRTSCKKFVIHPNKGINEFIKKFLKMSEIYNDFNLQLCIETFAWRKKKEIRSPLEIVEHVISNNVNNLSMVIDTSHIEDVWFNYPIMKHLLKHTSVIHLSNRSKEFGQHLPFNDQRGDLNLVQFVKLLQRQYKWSGDIILEYMPEYQYKLSKNVKYIERLLGNADRNMEG